MTTTPTPPSDNMFPKNPEAFSQVLSQLKTNPASIESYLISNWKEFPPKNYNETEDLLHFCMFNHNKCSKNVNFYYIQ